MCNNAAIALGVTITEMTEEDWNNIKENIIYDFMDDNHFAELRDLEITEARMNSLQLMEAYIGQFYSKEYIRRYVLRQTETEMEEIDKQIEDEKEDGDDELGGAAKNPQQFDEPDDEALEEMAKLLGEEE